MFFRQYNLGCLSLFSYLIGDPTTGRAVVVDPQRDIAGYLADAAEQGLRIDRVIETHVHADFLSGHLELADATGAAISYGAGAATDFPIEELADGTRLTLGEVVIEVRATPGHTPESISLVVWEHADDDEPWGVLTGDALFLGDVGRPDLLTSAGRTADELARLLYHSLHSKLLTLPDRTRVYPAHGAGSACGKELSAATESTIGEQRAVNYALAPMTEDEFVEVVTEGQSAAPPYFAFASDANRRDHAPLDDGAAVPTVTVGAALELLRSGGVVLDTREPETFALGHLRGSINVGLDGRFAEYTGDVVRHDQPVIVVTEPGHASEARTRLARIGYDRVVGELAEIEAVLIDHPDLAGHAERLTAGDLAALQARSADVQIVDIRGPGEQATGVIAGATSIPLPSLVNAAGDGTLDPHRPTVVYCAGGYRSSIAASTLRALGFDEVADLLGGIGAWHAADHPVSVPQP
jgi:glyoxylase-like metal-dependent hydrolase (beta-lactamase superfamily II)/rhodanese-related sulfurtransferase